MKLGKQGISLALVAAGLVITPVAAVAAKPDPSGIDQLKADADQTVTLKKEGATGLIGYASTKGDLLPGVAADSKSEAAEKAREYLDKYAPVFGAEAGQLDQSKVSTTPAGWTVEFEQAYNDVPVFGGVLKAHVDKSGDLTSVNGFAAPNLDLSTTPKWSKEKASAKALELVKSKPADAHTDSTVDTTGVEVVKADLNIYRMGAAQGVSGKSLLAWVIEVSNQSTVRETIVLDAASGKPVNRYSMLHSATDRELVEKHNTPDTGDDATVWNENDAFPGTLDQDQANEVATTGESYWLYKNTFGRDSYDGNGAKMVTVNNDPAISCPNANWNGATTNYCSGVTSDDVVAHEWGHAYTEYTSGLIYQWQPGALNEAYSDMWGNTVDFINARENTTDDVARTDGHCSSSTRGAIELTINSPADVAGACPAAAASFGPVFPTAGVTSDIVVGQDDPADGSPTNGCGAFTNAADIAGKFVFVDRGVCAFTQKVANASAAGAEGIVIGFLEGQPIGSIAGNADIYGATTDYATGQKIKNATAPVNITIKDASTESKDESVRWLMGEDSTAFGGAIRDMWNPNCYGDPAKVSDEEYHCDGATDSGGVHTNSGVINHHYALLVDGGSSNGATVAGIGLDKAANLIWHAQTNYLTPTSGFPEYAQAMVSSCADLTGVTTLKKLTLGTSTPQTGGGETPGGEAEAPALEPITATDCLSVVAANTATELTTEPVQCNFGPMLDPNTPALCGEGTNEVTTYTEDFEDGLTGWTQDAEALVAGNDYPWETLSDVEGNETKAAWGPDPVEGQCGDPAGDITSRNGLISPEITVPKGLTPRFTFDHSVRTESTWDGGNVKVSVNGGDFALVDQAAYLFNAPGATMADGSGYLQGEAAWTGTDGGKFTGQWGTTIIDLDAVADAGDKVKFRFDMARDGCNGVEGWAVDNVSVSYCTEKAVPEISATSPKHGKVEITVDGERASGEVVVYEKGHRIGRFRLKHEEATFRAWRGTHTYKVVYSGDRNNEAITETVTVKVR
ncbi:Thermolysin metallopeptidase, alpha-helical domain [Nocardioides sp. YR527]|uniref:M4 family metallopeptidase n=1 Tax=Nocardioides sp. YR527 TaxID=1881028 RepID=UPI000888E61B|nr:M4 family metallopeptidase [Nocardioides sp. YR527]SDK29881.1 Thermolysin metallopeptidase, alpha-helical domain [Nocardioides sp. YR527]